MALPEPGYQLTGISPRAFQHPADRAAAVALRSVPYLDKVVRKLIELGYERALISANLGSSVKLGEQQLGRVWREHNIAYATLDMERVPDLYLAQGPWPNAHAVGAKHTLVIASSELVRLLDAPMQRAVFAHEAAHILSDHMLYRTAVDILASISASVLPVPTGPLNAALLEWSRASEYSCDRAAALAIRDPLTVCRMLMVVSAGEAAAELDLDQFMAQGLQYLEPKGGLQRLSRLFAELNMTHAMPVKRVHELMKWVQSGEYDRIVGGEYLRRDAPEDVREEAGEAAGHYSEKARDVFREAGDAVNAAGQQLSDWLAKRS